MIETLQKILKQFRSQLYLLFPKRKDAILNLLDALTSFGHCCSSIVELSESSRFGRKYSSVTDAIADGLPHAHWDKVQELVYKHTFPQNDLQPHRFVTDCTSAKRPFAKKLSDRTVNHSPNPAPGNKPICVGHQYSVTALLPPESKDRSKRWVIPVSAKRVKSSEKGSEVGMKDITNCIENLNLDDQLCVSIGDSLYGTNKCRKIASKKKNLVHIFRLNSKRNIYFPPNKSGDVAHNKGRKKVYGEKLNLGDITPNTACDQEKTFDFKTSKGKRYKIVLKCWRNMLLRGSRDFNSSQHPLNLLQVRVTNEEKDEVFKRPLYLGVLGDRRDDISIMDCYENYRRRYDIEHFFRFGKNKLLLDSYQTPDVDHEELWWKFCMVGYSQLYLSRKLSSALPKPWERYLDENKKTDKNCVSSPTQTQRNFSKLLESIGTPAKKSTSRGCPLGRSMGEKPVKRINQPVIFKTKKPKPPGDKTNISGFEKTKPSSNPQKLEDLLKFVTCKLVELNIPVEKFREILIT